MTPTESRALGNATLRAFARCWSACVGTIGDDKSLTRRQAEIQQHDLLVLASRSIDDATAEACGIPAFSALYAASGFPDCHFVLEIAIAAYTPEGTPGTCSSDGRPDFLPCWRDDGDHLAVDCVNDDLVAAIDGRWQNAGPPREVAVDRTDPDAVAGDDVIVSIKDPACSGIADLFLTGPSPSGSLPDVDRLRRAVSALGPETRDLVENVIDSTLDPPTLEVFESLLRELDELTVTRCGLPLVSAWASVAGTIDALPCWLATGAAYPAYEQVACIDFGS